MSDAGPVNQYGKQLTAEEIAAGHHRELIGGLWEEMGALQIDFLRAQGLKPRHRVLDVGCGALRGGLPMIRYLRKGHYYGMDINASLLEAGRGEVRAAGLDGKEPHLLEDARFDATSFGVTFDFAIAQSVFTHVTLNHVSAALNALHEVMKPRGTLFATYFPAPVPGHQDDIEHPRGGVTTHHASNPFHYSSKELASLGSTAGWHTRDLGDWEHPRDQHMMAFRAPRRWRRR